MESTSQLRYRMDQSTKMQWLDSVLWTSGQWCNRQEWRNRFKNMWNRSTSFTGNIWKEEGDIRNPNFTLYYNVDEIYSGLCGTGYMTINLIEIAVIGFKPINSKIPMLWISGIFSNIRVTIWCLQTHLLRTVTRKTRI